MTHRSDLFPDLGFGLGLRALHYPDIFAAPAPVDWFEIISENFMDTQGRARRHLARIREHYPVVMHGVSLSIGSTDGLDLHYLRQLKQLAQDIEPAWISDHLCWTGVAHQNLHDLLPLPYTEEALAHVVSRVQQVQEFLGRPIALENPSTYLSFASSHIPEAEFLAELTRRSGCHLLLDVNNVYVSAFNHRLDVQAYLAALPMDRVVQIHLSGHSHCGTHLIDTHDSPVVDAVWALYAEVLRRAGRVPNTMIEWDDHIPSWPDLLAELDQARAVAAGQRPTADIRALIEPAPTTLTPAAAAPPPALAREQARLQEAILHPAPASDAPWIRAQPHVAPSVQLGVYVHAYAARLYDVTAEDYPVLGHYLGEARFADLLHAYVRQTPSRHFNIGRYTAGFAAYLATQGLDDPLALELATLEAALARLQDAPESPALSTENLAHLGEDRLARAVLTLREASQCLAFAYPTETYYTQVRQDQAPPVPQAAPSHVLLYRHDDVVWRMNLESGEYALLQALSQGLSVGEACAQLAAQCQSQTLDQDVQRWFARWMHSGIFSHAHVPARHPDESLPLSPDAADPPTP